MFIETFFQPKAALWHLLLVLILTSINISIIADLGGGDVCGYHFSLWLDHTQLYIQKNPNFLLSLFKSVCREMYICSSPCVESTWTETQIKKSIYTFMFLFIYLFIHISYQNAIVQNNTANQNQTGSFMRHHLYHIYSIRKVNLK